MSSRPFHHEALFYDGPEGFVADAVPFIRAGLEAEEPTMVAVVPERIAMLRDELGGDADDVHFADMAAVGRNPGRIIPAWRDFVTERGGAGRSLRGIGEPIWAGRSPAEVVECQIHEGLLNVAFAGDRGFHLLCPYDARALEEGVVHQARCTHPLVVEEGRGHPSHGYRNGDSILALADAPLPPPPSGFDALAFDRSTLEEVRAVVAGWGERAPLTAAATSDLVIAVNEVAANSVRHGGGDGVLRAWRDGDVLVCEVRDRGHIADPLVGRVRPGIGASGGWGVFIAHHACDLVQVRSGADGTVVRLHMHCG